MPEAIMIRQPFGPASVLRGDARSIPLASNSVDLVVTSPPYFALRSYQDGGQHYAGQLGSEPTPDAYIDTLLEATVECVRVLKRSGSLWVNLGDKYAGSAPGRLGASGSLTARVRSGYRSSVGMGVATKSLMGIPWRYALRCIDDLGLILRAELIWAKPNGLPESVTDRVRRCHEQWFHFTLAPQYYSATDEIRDQLTTFAGFRGHAKHYGKAQRNDDNRNNVPKADPTLGRVPGSVWEIATEPLSVPVALGIDHFAAFPLEWPRRIIQGWSPPGVCTACGEGRRPVSIKSAAGKLRTDHGLGGKHEAGRAHNFDPANNTAANRNPWANDVAYSITGYACACPEPTAPTRPAIVLDPFGGTGTTALAARALGRHGVSVDMSADYCRLARWRTTDEGELARALQVTKPAAQVDGQLTIYDELEG